MINRIIITVFFSLFLTGFLSAQGTLSPTLPNGYSGRLIQQNTSKTSQSYLFNIQHNNIDLFNHQLRYIQFVNNKEETYFSHQLESTSFPEFIPESKSAITQLSKWINGDEVLIEWRPVYFETPSGFVNGYAYILESNADHKTLVLDEQGKLLFSTSNKTHSKPDSVVAINIFRPDPITSALTEYGLGFQDFNDSTSPDLAAQLVLDSITLKWDTNDLSWKMENEAVKAVDFSQPFISPYGFYDSTYLLTRSDTGFEYLNAFYHLTKMNQHVKELGFVSLLNATVGFDAYGDIGDQSSFIPSTTNPRLQFGVGGVDDAEDADVIIHEYGHAISYAASPETNYGDERKAVDEGFCDFLAYAYSLKINPYDSMKLFNWDGHNEYWVGREIPQFKTYPTDLKNSIYLDGGIYTSALKEVSDIIGTDKTEELVIESAHWFFGNMQMVTAGYFLMKADTLLNDANHADEIKIILCAKGLYPGCEDTLLTTLPISDPYLGNTEGFANGENHLFVFPNKTDLLSYSISDLSGKIIQESAVASLNSLPYYRLETTIQTKGIYVLRLETKQGVFAFKIMRL